MNIDPFNTMTDLQIRSALYHIAQATVHMKMVVHNHPGCTNAQLTRIAGLTTFSKKQFLTHYLCNVILYPSHDIKRRRAEYFPTKAAKVAAKAQGSIAELHACINAIAQDIIDIIRTRWNEHNALCNSDLSRLLHSHETLTGNHKGWFTHEFVKKLEQQLDICILPYGEMSTEMKRHVNQSTHRHNKKYLIPMVHKVKPVV